MREATGGGMLMYLIIPIVLLLIAFIIFIAKYAIAYRDVNTCISMIESCQGRKCSSGCEPQTFLSKYDNVTVEYEQLGNDMCMVHIRAGVKFEAPFFGEFTFGGVRVDSKAMYCNQ